MAASKFNPKTTSAFVDLIRSGLSYEDAAREINVREKTVKTWLTKGRREENGPHREFADAVDDARLEAREVEAPGDEADLMLLTWAAAKKGSVQAMKLYWEMVRKPTQSEEIPTDPFAELDGPVDLAVVREQKAAGQ